MAENEQPAGSPGTEGFWADIDRQYDTEFRHHKRMSRLHQQNVSLAAQQFQSQMLGLMLLGESEQPLAGQEAPKADPTAQP